MEKEFDEKNIEEKKHSLEINKEEKSFKLSIFDKKLRKKVEYNIEYLRSSEIFKSYIKKDLVEKINIKEMLNNIDTLIAGKNIDIYGLDEEINYDNLFIIN